MMRVEPIPLPPIPPPPPDTPLWITVGAPTTVAAGAIAVLAVLAGIVGLVVRRGLLGRARWSLLLGGLAALMVSSVAWVAVEIVAWSDAKSGRLERFAPWTAEMQERDEEVLAILAAQGYDLARWYGVREASGLPFVVEGALDDGTVVECEATPMTVDGDPAVELTCGPPSEPETVTREEFESMYPDAAEG